MADPVTEEKLEAHMRKFREIESLVLEWSLLQADSMLAYFIRSPPKTVNFFKQQAENMIESGLIVSTNDLFGRAQVFALPAGCLGIDISTLAQCFQNP